LWWNWELDRDTYPNWRTMVQDLRAKDIRVVSYINPYLVDVEKKQKVRRNMFREAKERGFLVRRQNNEVYTVGNGGFDAGLVDLSNPDAYQWLKDIIKTNMIDTGVSGWMGDFGEALPYDSVLAGASPKSFHNQYPERWAQLQREAIQEAQKEGDVVFFSRSGSIKSPGYSTLFWLGDQMISWDEHDGMKSSLTGLLSGGLSGYSLNHGDIGGYLSLRIGKFPLGFYRRSEELLTRWMEFGAMTPVFRIAEGNSLGVQYYSNHRTWKALARNIKLFQAWFDYRKTLFREAETHGLPVVRHMMLEFPQDPLSFRLGQQYMLGSDFLVAPVMDPRRKKLNVYLPAGNWTHVWRGREFNLDSGRWVEVDAPIGEPAIFVRSGSSHGRTFIENLDRLGLRGH